MQDIPTGRSPNNVLCRITIQRSLLRLICVLLFSLFHENHVFSLFGKWYTNDIERQETNKTFI